MDQNDVRKMIYGTLIGFLLMLVGWIGFVYVSACGFTLTCNRSTPLVIRTPIPTLIPARVQPQMEPDVTAFDKCQISASGLIGAWVSAGSPETEPFQFTDLNGQTCEGTFADIQPLFVENSLWFPGSLGCISCHNSELGERSAGLDLSSYDAVLLGTRRVPEATSPGTDILGRGEWEKSLLYEVLVNQGLTTLGHSAETPVRDPIVYAGRQVNEADATATPTP